VNKCQNCGKQFVGDYRLCAMCEIKDAAWKRKPTLRTTEPKDDNPPTKKLPLPGRCVCGKPSQAHTISCWECWLKALAHKHLGNRDQWTTLESKWTGQCHYTGRKITPGVNASLDHVDPAIRGGPKLLDNLVWCDLQINRMKSNTPLAIFIHTCQVVASFWRTSK